MTATRSTAHETTRRWSRWVPWDGRPSRVDLALLTAIAGVIGLGLVLKPLTAFLIAAHPALLALLTGDLSAIGATAAYARIGELPIWWAVAAGSVGMVKFDWLTWWIGRRWGHRVLGMLSTPGQARRWSGWAQTADPRLLGVAVVCSMLPGVPTAVVLVLAGWSGMRLASFLALDLLGALLVTGVVVAVGYGAGQRAVDLVLLIDRYASAVTLALIGAALLLPLAKHLLHRRRDDHERTQPQP